MKSFFAVGGSTAASIHTYRDASASVEVLDPADPARRNTGVSPDGESSCLCARIAVYDSSLAAPRVEDISANTPGEMINSLSERVYELVRVLGVEAPYTVLREIVENLIHAEFREIVVSVLDGGRTIRFADQGPGISDKPGALKPGFTTATAGMKNYIRGVGSGLPIVGEFLSREGGALLIEDNLGRGTVVTLSFDSAPLPVNQLGDPLVGNEPEVGLEVPQLTLRQKKVLSLVMELGEVGPTLVSNELAVGLSTAYRDLASLEDLDLIEGYESGKRVLTTKGSAFLDRLFD